MYYSHPCSYCTKLFYTYHSSKGRAASILYYGIKQHLIDYNEDHKEFDFDDGPSIDIKEVYAAVSELSDRPLGGYKL